jgi:N-methylhydantoinase B/oxoprolinase/acetone carboxylase alpha subunit
MLNCLYFNFKDVFILQTPGGGGFGSCDDRSNEKIILPDGFEAHRGSLHFYKYNTRIILDFFF